MIELIKIAISITPVFIFLLALIYLDSFKLVKLGPIIQTMMIGCLTAMASFYLNIGILTKLSPDINSYSRYVAPFIEELVKAIFLIYLIKRKKIGFMVDGAIYGFAVGAGFAFVENLYYLYSLENSNLLLWIIRGLGTAIMHGGTCAIFVIISKSLTDRYVSTNLFLMLPGLLTGMIIHSFFNHFLLSPFLMTITQLVFLPILIIIIFSQSEKILREWLEIGLDADVFLLEYIDSGEFSKTKIGSYLSSLKEQFSGEIIADLFCYIRIHLELSVRSKGMLLMKESGFPSIQDPEIKEKFTELEFLEKSIGKTGKLAISPILHTSTRDLWQLFMLGK